MAGTASQGALPAPFQDYDLDQAYDEMVAPDGTARPHYEHLYQALRELPASEFRRRQQISDLSFLHQGITFTVYGRTEARNGFSQTICCPASSRMKSGRVLRRDWPSASPR